MDSKRNKRQKKKKEKEMNVKETYCKWQLHLNTVFYFARLWISIPKENYLNNSMCSYVHLSWFYYGSFSTVTRSVGFAGVSLSGNETAGSIIRSDSKSLCKVFCIITYQSQNSHPQILWVTKHQQFPHYCPPKSSPSNDKGRRRSRGWE